MQAVGPGDSRATESSNCVGLVTHVRHRPLPRRLLRSQANGRGRPHAAISDSARPARNL